MLANAAAPAPSLNLALSTGVALPVGDALNLSGEPQPTGIRQVKKTELPISLQLGFRATANLMPVIAVELSPSLHDVSPYSANRATRLRAGAEWHLMPEGAFDPWCALGVGVAWFSFAYRFLAADGTSPSSGLMRRAEKT